MAVVVGVAVGVVVGVAVGVGVAVVVVVGVGVAVGVAVVVGVGVGVVVVVGFVVVVGVVTIMARKNPTEEELRMMIGRGHSKEHGCKPISPSTGKKHPVAARLTGHAPLSQQFFVPGLLPGQNTFMGNGNRWTYGKAKKQWAVRIALAIAQAKLQPMHRVQITWVWQERNTRRDPDNFTGISKKFILDTLVSTGILPDDGWDEIAGWTDRWTVDAANPGVMITLTEVL